VSTHPCDACGRRLRPNHHELHLSDPQTGQLVGRYHAPRCQAAAAKYFVAKLGVVLVATYVHPDRCGENQEHCDGGLAA
jgi:predicted RNA-binding Zn-ribbon protein involved in translation (DUF1610 family)